MKRLVLRPAARRDLGDIWLYSASQWGADHAENYAQQIKDAIYRARELPGIGGEAFGLPGS